MAKIKICGLQSTEDIQMVNQSKPDYIGFVFAGTKRRISDEQARRLKRQLDPRILAVGVFVNDSIAHIADLCNRNVIDIVQLHGDESKEYIVKLRKYMKKPIIQAIRLRDSQDASRLLESKADYILYDSFVANKIYGGSGKPLDASLLPKLTRPTFLAGGISINNVIQIIREHDPYCIDVSSSVETYGRKDAAKVKEMIQIVREYGGHENE